MGNDIVKILTSLNCYCSDLPNAFYYQLSIPILDFLILNQ